VWPRGLTDEEMRRASDHLNSRIRPTPPPSPPPSYFTVDGPCTVDGACARSPNYPSNYGDRQSCTITPTSLAVGQLLSATAFDTESCCDKLIVNGVTYSHTTGPSNVLLGSAFTWSSDYSVTRAGWEVCARAPPPPPTPHYTLMNNALSWGEADAACLAAGLQLATVQSAAQNAALVTAAAGNQVWIGGTDAASEGAWVWSPSNTPLSYTNWYAGEPNNANGGEDCLQFNYKIPGKWNDWGCFGKRKYVCQPPPPPYYTLMSDALSWGDANAACLAAGLQLASVHSAAQNALLLTAAAGNTVWIGGTDAASEGAWVWSPSNTPLSYTNWNAGEPNNAYGGQDCMQIYSSGKWDDTECSTLANRKKYVCQQPH